MTDEVAIKWIDMHQTWTRMQPQKPSGRQDHWTDRIAAADDEVVDVGPGFVPNKVVKRTKLKNERT